MDAQTQKELLKIVGDNYDKIADEFSETRKKFLWPALFKLTEEVKKGDRVLDVGCGNGRLLDALHKKRVVYLGLDSSKKLIHNAQALHIGYNFRIGDILHLGKIPEVGFDYVYSVAVLQHIPGTKLQVSDVRQLKNKIKPGGKIIISVWNMWSRKWKKQAFKKKIFKFWLLKLIKKNKMDFGDILFDWKNSQGEHMGKRYYHAFRKRELKKVFKKAGLRV